MGTARLTAVASAGIFVMTTAIRRPPPIRISLTGNSDPDVNHPYHMGGLPNLNILPNGVGNCSMLTVRRLCCTRCPIHTPLASKDPTWAEATPSPAVSW